MESKILEISKIGHFFNVSLGKNYQLNNKTTDYIKHSYFKYVLMYSLGLEEWPSSQEDPDSIPNSHLMAHSHL